MIEVTFSIQRSTRNPEEQTEESCGVEHRDTILRLQSKSRSLLMKKLARQRKTKYRKRSGGAI